MAEQRVGRAILELTTDQTGLQRGLGVAEQKVNRFGSTVRRVGGMLAGAFSVAAVTGFVRDLTSFASEMTDLAATTGIGVERLQALNYVGAAAGVEVSQLADAVADLADRLVRGEAGAVSALGRLGLEAEHLIQMAPDQAFLAIAERVAEIPNPMERAAVMMALFSDTGARLLPLVTEELRALIGAAEHSSAVIDEDLVRAADAFDDALGQLWLRTRAVTALLVGGFVEGLRSAGDHQHVVARQAREAEEHQQNLTAAFEQAKQAVGTLAAEGLEPLAISLEDAKRIEKDIEDQIAATNAALRDQQTAAQEAAEALEERLRRADEHGMILLRAEADRQERERQQREAHLQAADETARLFLERELDAYTAQKEAKEALDAEYYQLLSEVANQTGLELMEKDRERLEAMRIDWRKTLEEVSEALGDLGAIGGQVMGDLSRSVGTVVSAVNTATQSIGSLTTGLRGITSGSGLSNILGGFASMVGGIGGIVSAATAAVSVIKGIGSAIAGLFQSEETKHVNKPRDKFFAQYGGFEGLAAKLTEKVGGDKAEALIRRLYDADTKSKFSSAQDAIIALIGGQKFAQGGIAMKPIAGVFGEAGPEALIPLDRFERMIGREERSQTITVYLDSREITRAVVRGMPSELSVYGLA